jgi:hypothetical protein
MQFVACKFRAEDARSYTYHNDGEPLAVGEIVKVADARSDGWKRVTVVSISDEAPPFPTKPILGKLDPEPAPEATAEPQSDAPDADDAVLQSFMEGN